MSNPMKRAREKAGMSIKRLSKLSGVSVSTISGWERGGHGPSVDSARLVCDVLGVSLDEYIGRRDKRG